MRSVDDLKSTIVFLEPENAMGEAITYRVDRVRRVTAINMQRLKLSMSIPILIPTTTIKCAHHSHMWICASGSRLDACNMVILRSYIATSHFSSIFIIITSVTADITK